MASGGGFRERGVAEFLRAPDGLVPRVAPAERTPWQTMLGTLVDIDVPAGGRISEGEYAAYTGIAPTAEFGHRMLTLDPPEPEDAGIVADPEFEAIMRMKTEPLVLDEAEAAMYADLRQRRARPVGKPLPIE